MDPISEVLPSVSRSAGKRQVGENRSDSPSPLAA